MSIENCQKWLRQQGKCYPRTCAECGLKGPCKYVSGLGSPEADADVAAARLVMHRASNEVVKEVRQGSATMTTSKWYALYAAICDCWPELDTKQEG